MPVTLEVVLHNLATEFPWQQVVGSGEWGSLWGVGFIRLSHSLALFRFLVSEAGKLFL